MAKAKKEAIEVGEIPDRVRLIGLEIEAYKGIRACAIDFDGKPVITLNGQNGAGKSSIGDAILTVLAGGSYIPEKPIRAGHKKATITLTMGRDATKVEFIATRSETPSGGTTKITDAEGNPIKGGAREFLDALYTARGFDPLAFAKQPPRLQIETLRAVTGLDETFAKIEAEKADAATARRDAQRTVVSLETQLAGLAESEGPEEEQSAADLIRESQEATEQKSKNDNARKWLADNKKKRAEQDEHLATMRDNLAKAEQLRDELSARIDKYEPDVAKMVDPDTTAITQKLNNLEAHNSAARNRRQRRGVVEQLAAARAEEKKANRTVEEADAKRRLAIEKADLPVDGLVFDDNGVYLEGVPLAQVNTAKQIEVGVALALAEKKPIRFIWIQDGALLDSNSRRALHDVAVKHDAQVLIERANDGTQEADAILIVDGEVAGDGE